MEERVVAAAGGRESVAARSFRGGGKGKGNGKGEGEGDETAQHVGTFSER